MKTTSVFVKCPHSIDDVLLAISGIVGSKPRLERLDVGDVYRATWVGIDVTVIPDHGLEADSGIRFDDYNVQVLLSPHPNRTNTLEFEKLLVENACHMAAGLASTLGCRTMVVSNLQHLLAEFCAGEE